MMQQQKKAKKEMLQREVLLHLLATTSAVPAMPRRHRLPDHCSVQGSKEVLSSVQQHRKHPVWQVVVASFSKEMEKGESKLHQQEQQAATLLQSSASEYLRKKRERAERYRKDPRGLLVRK